MSKPPRKRIRVEGKWYRVVPWLVPTSGSAASGCEGCAFDKQPERCINKKDDQPCDDGHEFEWKILIPDTPEGMAEYVAKRLEETTE